VVTALCTAGVNVLLILKWPAIFKNQRGKKGVRELNPQHTYSKGSNLERCLFQLFVRQRQKGSNEKDEDLTKESLLQREKFYVKELCVFSYSPPVLGAPGKHNANTRKSDSKPRHLLSKKPSLNTAAHQINPCGFNNNISNTSSVYFSNTN